jgi:AICAR transformylase/IMP cyclohydrolase PurH
MTFARVRALVVVGGLAVAAVIFVVVALVRDTQNHAQAGVTCPPGAPRANLTLPEPKEVKVKVFNATTNDGWASQISEDFRNRGFQTQKPQDNKTQVQKVAVLRYGPNVVGAAQLLRAYFLNEATMQYDAKRKNDVVDVVIGTKFQQLATLTEVNQALVEIGEPDLPPGACPADAPQ